MGTSIYGVTKYGEDTYGVSIIVSLVPSYLGLRVNFSEAVFNDSNLLNPDSYDISPYQSPAVKSGVVSVTPGSEVGPTFIDLECTDLTHGKGYTFTLKGGLIQDAGETKYYVEEQANYVGVSEMPVIQSISAISENEFQLVFSKSMEVNADLLDESRYVFDNGLQVLRVTSVSPGVVKIRTTKQIPSQYYTLTVT